MTSPSPGRPVASIIVPSYRGAARLPALLDSLARQEHAPAFEVIVVVDGVDDGSVALVEAESRVTARAVLLPENRGRAGALNAGLAAATGEVLIRCDDDLVVSPAFVAAHTCAHAAAEGPVAVAGITRDVHPDTPYARAYGRAAGERAAAHAAGRPAAERWRHWAANCSITRATAERIGPYDAAYRDYGWEDVDYGWRLHAAGIPLLRVPATDAEHHGAAPTTTARALKAFDAGGARETFRRLHPEAPLADPGAGGGPWGAAVRAVARRHRTRSAIARAAGRIDAVIARLPRRAAEKLVALAVESAAVAGSRTAAAAAAPPRPRVAIAHDYLTQRGGAERVVLSLCRAFPEAEVHTLLYAPDQTYPEYRERRIRTSPLNRIGPLRRDPRLALPVLAPLASRLRIDADVVIASSSGWAHAFPVTGHRLVYCHSPARWLHLPEDYLGATTGPLAPQRLALRVLARPLLAWDRRAARSADAYLANSTVVRERIRAAYGIDAPTLFPPVSPDLADGPGEPIPDLAGWAGADATEGGHVLVVSRLQPYKHVDRVIEAFRDLPERRLLVIGRGPEGERLRALAPPNVRLLEGLGDAQLRWAYRHARALIAASHEDFGLTPLEAGAHGVPVLALRAGGYLDTVAEGVSGLFFDEPTPEAIREALDRLDEQPLDPAAIRLHVERFAEKRFITQIRAAVDALAERPTDETAEPTVSAAAEAQAPSAVPPAPSGPRTASR